MNLRLAVLWAAMGLVGVVLGGCGGGESFDGTRDDSGAIVEAGDVRVNAVRIGDCFNDSAPAGEVDESVVVVLAVPCVEPHDNEAFHLGSLVDGEFPGVEAVKGQVFEACVTQFESFVGMNYDESSLDVAYIYPSAASWGEGDRGFVCAVYDLDKAKLTGTMRGSGV